MSGLDYKVAQQVLSVADKDRIFAAYLTIENPEPDWEKAAAEDDDEKEIKDEDE